MTPQRTISPRTWSELVLLALIWGGSFLAIRIALDEIGPMTVVLHRTGWAMLALWAVVLARRLPVPREPAVWASFLVMGALNNAVPFTLMSWGQQFIESGLTAIFNAATAIFGVLLATLVFQDERLTRRRALGVAIGFAGVVAAIGLDALAGIDLRSLAQIAVIGGAFSYGLAAIWARARLGGLCPEVAAAGMLTGSTLLMTPLTIWAEGVPSLSLSASTWGAIAYFALVSTALAYLLYYRILASAGSGNLTLVTLLIPPVAILLGARVRDEMLRPEAWVGFALIALGLLVIDGRLFARRARVGQG